MMAGRKHDFRFMLLVVGRRLDGGRGRSIGPTRCGSTGLAKFPWLRRRWNRKSKQPPLNVSWKIKDAGSTFEAPGNSRAICPGKADF